MRERPRRVQVHRRLLMRLVVPVLIALVMLTLVTVDLA